MMGLIHSSLIYQFYWHEKTIINYIRTLFLLRVDAILYPLIKIIKYDKLIDCVYRI